MCSIRWRVFSLFLKNSFDSIITNFSRKILINVKEFPQLLVILASNFLSFCCGIHLWDFYSSLKRTEKIAHNLTVIMKIESVFPSKCFSLQILHKFCWWMNVANIRIVISANNPCAKMRCGIGENCFIDADGHAICKCITYCAQVMKPICAMVCFFGFFFLDLQILIKIWPFIYLEQRLRKYVSLIDYIRGNFYLFTDFSVVCFRL